MSGRMIFFERLELDRLVRFCGQLVAPLYQIEKRPEEARRCGAYRVRAVDGRILRRGHDLTRVLDVLTLKRMRVIGD